MYSHTMTHIPFRTGYSAAEVEKLQTGGRRIIKSVDILRYIQAGKAMFTLRSVESGKRYTFKVSKPKKEGISGFYVSRLYGPNNTQDYCYIGMYHPGRPGMKLYTTPCANINAATPEVVQAFDFVMRWLEAQPEMTPKIEFWHSNHCGRCGKLLTVPESIALGLGPECAGK